MHALMSQKSCVYWVAMKLMSKQIVVGLGVILLWQGGYFISLPIEGEAMAKAVGKADKGGKKSKLVSAASRSLLKTYCLRCHKTGKAKGGIDLSKDRTRLAVQKNGKVWQKVVLQTRSRIMPPEDEKQPTMEERLQLADYFETTLRDIDCDAVKYAGKPTLRRLNRTEYNNTVSDLMGVKIDATRDFPDDAKGYGFTNIGDVMFLSPLLLEKYLDSTQLILDVGFRNKKALAKLLFVLPSEKVTADAAGERVIGRFMSRAFRRPGTKKEIDARVKLFKRVYKDKKDFTESIKLSFKSILLSPEFLFRIERENDLIAEGKRFRVNDYQLATRLSYFLWSRMPDAELIRLADAGKLHEPDILRQQIKRMLASGHSIALSKGFAGQWLRFDEVKTLAKDYRRFPKYMRARSSMYRESEMFFDDLVKNNGSILNLLDSDYSFIDQKLATHYGIKGVKGNHFRKVKFTTRERGGVLGMASILSVTSLPLRTSPVNRGKWVMEEILGTEIPPPPADAGTLPKDDHQKDNLSFRKRLELHREDPVCASCHTLMDPIGFGMENYDGIGIWRTENLKQKIDASGVLPSGEKFNGIIEFKDILMKRKDEFSRQITQKMMVYALGRPLAYYDECHIQAGVKALKTNNYQIHAVIESIVMSYPFQYREKK